MIKFCAYIEPEMYYIKPHGLLGLQAFYLSFYDFC